MKVTREQHTRINLASTDIFLSRIEQHFQRLWHRIPLNQFLMEVIKSFQGCFHDTYILPWIMPQQREKHIHGSQWESSL